MFVTAKRFNFMKEKLENRIDILQSRLNSSNSLLVQNRKMVNDLEDLEDFLKSRIKDLESALTYISSQRTGAANATVTRMADHAEKALGTATRAEFIAEDKVQPAGTLADIGRMIKDAGKLSTTNPYQKTTYVTDVNTSYAFAPTQFDFNGLGDASDNTGGYSSNNSDTGSYGGYDGGSSGGGGDTGSWDSGSSSDGGSFGGMD